MQPFVSRFGIRRALCIGAMSALSVASLTAGAAPAKPVEVQQIELFQRLPAEGAASLKTLIERFNAQNKEYQVVLSEQGWKSTSAPHLMILEGDDEEHFLAGKQIG
ncbi:MAG: hypothetical protein PHG21_13055, partial [Azoarcus sp.]|nr:hypothetical protein [Azoarcus sp.]